MASCFVHAIKRKPLSQDTDAMKPRYRGDIVKGTKSGPHLCICSDSAIDVVEIERGFNFKEEDGQIVHLDDVGNDEVDRHTNNLGKGVLWLDGKSIIGEAHFIEDLVKHPVVLVSDGGVVRDASELVEYALWQHSNRHSESARSSHPQSGSGRSCRNLKIPPNPLMYCSSHMVW